MSIDVKLKSTCRTCLGEEVGDTCVSLHKVIELGNGKSNEISNMIEESIGLQIKEMDDFDLPLVICEQCATVITNFYLFRMTCLTNDKQLRKQFQNDRINYEIKVEDNDSFKDTDFSGDPFCHHFSSSENEDNSKAHETLTKKIKNSESCFTKVHECDICFESFDARKDLVHHRRENHLHEINEEYYSTVKKGKLTHYICKLCGHFCRHKNCLRVHLRSHTGEKPYKCSICPETFTQKCHVRKHMKIHNVQENPVNKIPNIFYRCELCNKGFRLEASLKLHYEQQHPDNLTRNYVSVIPKGVEQLCDICGKFLKSLSDHIRGHLGIKKFECNVCGKILSTASSLYQHRQRHTDEKKFVCDTCGKNFKLKHDLTFHRKIHFQERKHACHLCERKFLHKVGLRIHLKVHAGEKPYQVYDDRKRERIRLKRLEMIKNGIPFPKAKSRKKNTSKLDDGDI